MKNKQQGRLNLAEIIIILCIVGVLAAIVRVQINYSRATDECENDPAYKAIHVRGAEPVCVRRDAIK